MAAYRLSDPIPPLCQPSWRLSISITKGACWSKAIRRYSEAVTADVRRRMSPPHRQSVARISEELGIHVMTLYKWRKAWRLQGEVVPASENEPEGWSAADKFTVVLETAGLNATELSAYCRQKGLYPEQVDRWRQAAQDANEKPVLTM